MTGEFNPVIFYIFTFFIFSIIGWTVECTYRSLGEQRIINSGFLYGPICPIYGTGCLVFELCLVPLSEPIGKRLWLVLLLGVVLADTVEYVTSWLMEKLFHARWWDYSNNFLNLHGRICFKHSCYWALFAFLYVYFIAPMYRVALSYITPKIMNIALIVIFCVFIVDLILTVKAAADITKLMKKLSALKCTISDFGESMKEKAGSLMPLSSEKFNEWKSDVSHQYADIKKQFEVLNSTRGKGRLLYIYSSIKKSAEEGISEIEARWDYVKAFFTDSDSEMM